MMKQNILSFIFTVRAILSRKIFSKENYFLAAKSVRPLSRKFGFDRGTPIDRFWIESFLKDHARDIKGHVLEIGDNRYTRQYGSYVTKSDVLDLNPQNSTATIHADLTHVSSVADNTFDCIILTHVLGIIPEYQLAIAECYRLLKPKGVLLITASSMSPMQRHSQSFWRFTPHGLFYSVAKIFGEHSTSVFSYGNVLTGQCFWVGMAQEELKERELEFNDPEYPCIVAVRSVKQ